jgi:hypothetical protein
MGKGTYRGGSTLIRVWPSGGSSKRAALKGMLKGVLTTARKREAIAMAEAVLKARQEAASAERKAARAVQPPSQAERGHARANVRRADGSKVVVERRKLPPK